MLTDEQGQRQSPLPIVDKPIIDGTVTPGTEDPGQEPNVEKEEVKKQPDMSEILKSKAVQGEIDRRVTSALKKEALKQEQAVLTAVENERHAAEEAKLLEDGETQKLYELEKQRREDLEARVLSHERGEKIAALLDKKEIFDDRIRNIFMQLKGELVDLDSHADKINEAVEEMVTSIVNKRLESTPPPQSNFPGNEGTGTLHEQLAVAEKEAIETGDWNVYRRIANQISDQIAKRPLIKK